MVPSLDPTKERYRASIVETLSSLGADMNLMTGPHSTHRTIFDEEEESLVEMTPSLSQVIAIFFVML